MSDNRDIVERLEDEARVFEQTLLDETVDLIREAAAEIARLREERRWISVGERLPPNEEWVDVAGRWGDCIGWHDGEEWRDVDEDQFPSAVTHWRKRGPGLEVTNG